MDRAILANGLRRRRASGAILPQPGGLALPRRLRAGLPHDELRINLGDQHSYLLYPERELVPFLERITLAGDPLADDERLFVRDGHGRWHFQADLASLTDVDASLDAINVDEAIGDEVRDLRRTTFDHASFTGRSGRFFMSEGLA